jgi:hypothetical protein
MPLDTPHLTVPGRGNRVVLEGVTGINHRGSKVEEANEGITANNGSVRT